MELFMIKNKSPFGLLYLRSIMSPSAILSAQDISLRVGRRKLKGSKRNFATGISESNKRLAKSAGYDIDQLCSSLDLFELPDDDETQEPLVLPREDTQAQAPEVTSSDSNYRYRKAGVAKPRKLPAFGYDLFAGEPTSFEPASHIPVSPNYVLGPGDTVKVLFYGKINESHDLEINRDGSIEFPQLGPVSLAGMTFSDAKQFLQQRIKEEIIGIQASISLGELRSIQVFMLGEAYKPGTYTISALSTITNALFLSGGLSDIASLRNLS